MARIERATSPLPRECSTTELHRRNPRVSGTENPCIAAVFRRLHHRPAGAGEGNRTLVVSLEGFCSTIELHPPSDLCLTAKQCSLRLQHAWWRGKDSNLRRQSRQIYSLIPLTAREPLRLNETSDYARILTICQRPLATGLKGRQ